MLSPRNSSCWPGNPKSLSPPSVSSPPPPPPLAPLASCSTTRRRRRRRRQQQQQQQQEQLRVAAVVNEQCVYPHRRRTQQQLQHLHRRRRRRRSRRRRRLSRNKKGILRRVSTCPPVLSRFHQSRDRRCSLLSSQTAGLQAEFRDGQRHAQAAGTLTNNNKTTCVVAFYREL